MKIISECFWIVIVSGEVFEKLEHTVIACFIYLMNEISVPPILSIEDIT